MKSNHVDIDSIFDQMGYQKVFECDSAVSYEHFCQKLGYTKRILIYRSIDGVNIDEPKIEFSMNDGQIAAATETELSAVLIKLADMRAKYKWDEASGS